MLTLILVTISWIFLSLCVAFWGKSRKTGFVKALIMSLIFTPVTGLIIVLLSDKRSNARGNMPETNEYIEKGVSSFNLGRFNEAIEYFNKVIKLDPCNASAYYNRGSVKYECGDTVEAIVDFNRAIEIDPGDSKAYLNRGRSRLVLFGNDNEAISDFKKAAELGNKEALRIINEMGIEPAGIIHNSLKTI
jgi:tetratricopeptide (TPR) repeat protein